MKIFGLFYLANLTLEGRWIMCSVLRVVVELLSGGGERVVLYCIVWVAGFGRNSLRVWIQEKVDKHLLQLGMSPAAFLKPEPEGPETQLCVCVCVCVCARLTHLVSVVTQHWLTVDFVTPEPNLLPRQSVQYLHYIQYTTVNWLFLK